MRLFHRHFQLWLAFAKFATSLESLFNLSLRVSLILTRAVSCELRSQEPNGKLASVAVPEALPEASFVSVWLQILVRYKMELGLNVT